MNLRFKTKPDKHGDRLYLRISTTFNSFYQLKTYSYFESEAYAKAPTITKKDMANLIDDLLAHGYKKEH